MDATLSEQSRVFLLLCRVGGQARAAFMVGPIPKAQEGLSEKGPIPKAQEGLSEKGPIPKA